MPQPAVPPDNDRISTADNPQPQHELQQQQVTTRNGQRSNSFYSGASQSIYSRTRQDSISSLLPIHRHYTYHTGFPSGQTINSHTRYAGYNNHYQRYPFSTSSSATAKSALSLSSSPSSSSSSPKSIMTINEVNKQLIDGLNYARFDQVRRAVLYDETCLKFKFISKNNNTTKELYPVAYALSNCEVWHALSEHCRRSGVPIQQVIYGDLTFSERLSAMNIILPWLIQYSNYEDFSNFNLLYSSLNCGLYRVSFALLEKQPCVAKYIVKGGKTFVHIVCSLITNTHNVSNNNNNQSHNSSQTTTTTKASANSMSDDMASLLIHKLCSRGADVRIKDVEGVTPLLELIHRRRKLNRPLSTSSSISPTQQQDENHHNNNVNNENNVYGLVLRRRRGYGDEQDEKNNASRLEAVSTVIETLVMHGSRMEDIRSNKISSSERNVVMNNIMKIRQRVCGEEIMNKWNNNESRSLISSIPLWGLLPDEVIAKILSHLSPVQIVSGIGSTCLGLKALTTSPSVWVHFDS